MKDPQSAESKEKENFWFFSISIFRVMVIFGHFCDVITTIFDEFFTITREKKSENRFFIRFDTLRIIHKKKTDQN